MKKSLLILLSSLSCAAMAEGSMYNDVKPVYFNINTGVATGYSFSNNNNTNNTNSAGQPSTASTNNYSLGANVGYNYNQFFATEVGYNHLWLSGTQNNPNGQVGVEDIAAKGTIPLGDTFALYGRAGVAGYQDVSGSGATNFANNMGVLYGAGAQWALSKNWALRAEDWSVTGLGQNIIQFGAQLSF